MDSDSEFAPKTAMQAAALEVLRKHRGRFHIKPAERIISASCENGDVVELEEAIRCFLPDLKPLTGVVTTELPSRHHSRPQTPPSRSLPLFRWRAPDREKFINFTQFLIANDIASTQMFLQEDGPKPAP